MAAHFKESLLVSSSVFAMIVTSFFVTVVNGRPFYADQRSVGLSDELLQLGFDPAKKLHLRLVSLADLY